MSGCYSSVASPLEGSKAQSAGRVSLLSGTTRSLPYISFPICTELRRQNIDRVKWSYSLKGRPLYHEWLLRHKFHVTHIHMAVFINVLLLSSSHAVQFAHLKCTVHFNGAFTRVTLLVAVVEFRTFLLPPPKEILPPLALTPRFPSVLPAQGNH